MGGEGKVKKACFLEKKLASRLTATRGGIYGEKKSVAATGKTHFMNFIIKRYLSCKYVHMYVNDLKYAISSDAMWFHAILS